MIELYQRMIDRLKPCKRVLVTTHVRPDGDALGTTAALVLGLRKVGITSEVLLLSGLPQKYAFVYRDNGIDFHEVNPNWPDTLQLDRFDALLVADTGTWSQLPGLKERLTHWSKPKLVLDHHQTQEDWADEKLVLTEASAAGEIAAELLDVWQVPLDRAMASALFLAVASDTGWFQFSNTRPQTLRLAARLMEAGVGTDQLYQLLYQNERVQRIALQARALHSLELLSDGRVAVMRICKADYEQTSADPSDTENLINIPLQVRSVEVSVLLNEQREPGPIRVSLRSKGQVNVAKFAEQFGGGGHARASGLRLDGSLQGARDKIAAAMEQSLRSCLKQEV